MQETKQEQRQWRWGVLGSGRISKDFAQSLYSAVGHRACITAVGARSIESSRKFKAWLEERAALHEKHAGDKEKTLRFTQEHVKESVQCYGSYAEVAKRDDVDICYVGVIHVGHFRVALECIRAGKHVLIEKPFTINAKQAKVLQAAAAKHKVMVLEALWSRFIPTYGVMRSLLGLQWGGEGGRSIAKDRMLGDVMDVRADFGFRCGARKERLFSNELGGGALLDVGIYPVSVSHMVCGWGATRDPQSKLPTGVVQMNVSGVLGEWPEEKEKVPSQQEDGRIREVDLCNAINLLYSRQGDVSSSPDRCPIGKGIPVSLSSSIIADTPRTMVVTCTEGSIWVPGPYFHCSGVLFVRTARKIARQLVQRYASSERHPANTDACVWADSLRVVACEIVESTEPQLTLSMLGVSVPPAKQKKTEDQLVTVCIHCAPTPPSHLVYNYVNSHYLHYQAGHLMDCLERGLLESPVLPVQETVDVMHLLDSVRGEMGFSYSVTHESAE